MLRRRFRTHRLAIYRSTRSSDGQGGWTATTEPAGTVDGSLQPAGAAEQVDGDQPRGVARWLLFTDLPLTVRRGDELVHVASLNPRSGTATPVEDGRRFRVLATGDWQAAGPVDHGRVDLEELQLDR